MKIYRYLLFHAGLVALALVVSGQTRAETAAEVSATPTAEATGLEEIVVNAQKRSESINRVPISITAFTPEKLSQLNITDLQDVAAVTPGLVFNTNSNAAQPFIRGIGANFATPGLEPPVAIYTDDVYSPRAFASALDLVDISSVQVLRGPQGTLYGRNATGGAFLVSTADPTPERSGYIDARYGRFDEFRVDAVANLPIAQTLDFRLAIRYSSRDGYVVNPANGNRWGGYENIEARGKLKWTPTDNFKMMLTFQNDSLDNYGVFRQQELKAPACFTCNINGATVPGFYRSYQGYHVKSKGYADLGVLRADLDLGAADVTSITGYRRIRLQTGTDEGGVGDYPGPLTNLIPLRVAIDIRGRDFSQEFRVRSKFSGMVNFLAGANFQSSLEPILFDLDGFALGDFNPAPVLPTPGNTTQQATLNTVDTRSWSVYGEAYVDVTSSLRLTAGARYTEDRKNATIYDYPLPPTHPAGPAPAASFVDNVKFSAVTPRFVASYDTAVGDFYFSYNKGFKSGGINTPAFAPGPALKPEKIDSFEVGAKNSFFDQRLKTRVSVFDYHYKDIQVAVLDPVTESSIKQNASGARIHGAEIEVDAAATNHISISAGGSWLHARYESYPNASILVIDRLFGTSAAHPLELIGGKADATGTPLSYSPNFTAFLEPSFHTSLPGSSKMRATAIVRYSDAFLFNPLAGGVLGLDQQGAFTTLGLTADFGPQSGRWTVGIYGDNVTGTKYNTNVNTNTFGAYRSSAPPATYGVTARYNFF